MKNVLFCFVLFLTFSAFGQEFIGPHGYLTFEAEISDKDSTSRNGTFDLHHFNLLANYLISGNAQVFGEIEWEHGADLENKNSGFVRIERAWFEYEFSKKFSIRIGKFLTPYGIFNIVHDAAPAWDFSILPQSIYGEHKNALNTEQKFYSKFSIGIMLHGHLDVLGADLTYKTFISNGRGERPFEQDDNKDKAYGLRLITNLEEAGIKLGYSFYTEKNGLVRDSRQFSHTFDFRGEYGRWRLISEFARSFLESPGEAFPDQWYSGGYAELGFQLFRNTMLIARYDLLSPDTQETASRERDISIGTSVKVMSNVLVKSGIHFWHIDNNTKKDFIQGIASLAVVF